MRHQGVLDRLLVDRGEVEIPGDSVRVSRRAGVKLERGADDEHGRGKAARHQVA
jgi:hypothetical protein